jgi:hypothetical protein
MAKQKQYNDEGMRLTDCCGACSTFDESGNLYCKACFKGVSEGEGDGCDYLPGREPLKNMRCVWSALDSNEIGALMDFAQFALKAMEDDGPPITFASSLEDKARELGLIEAEGKVKMRERFEDIH